MIFVPVATATARRLHGRYLQCLDEMQTWFGTGDNADRTALLNLLDAITGAVDQHRADDEDLPSAEELRAALDTERTSALREDLDKLRSAVESAAFELLEHLETPAFLNQFELLPVDDQIALMAQVTEGLCESSNGLSYLTHHGSAPLTDDQTAPALHLSRLPRRDGAFRGEGELSAALQDNASAVTRTFANFLPALLAREVAVEDTTVGWVVETVVEPFFDFRPLQQHGYLVGFERFEDIRTREELREATIDILRYEQETPQWLARLGDAAIVVRAVLNLVLLTTELDRLVRNPDARNALGFQLALLRAVDHTEAAIRALQRRQGQDVARGAVMRTVGVLATLTDVAVNAWDAVAAFRRGDRQRGFGHASVGLGGVTSGMVLSGLLRSGALRAGVFIPGPAGLVVLGVGVALTVVGYALIAFAPPEHPLLTRYRHTYFGTSWGDLSRRETSQTVRDLNGDRAHFFRWKGTDRSPDLQRQRWDLQTVLNPLVIDAAEVQGVDDPLSEARQLTLRIRPSLGSPGSYVAIRLFDLGNEQWYVLPLQPGQPPAFDWLPMPPTVYPPAYAQGAEQVQLWECTIAPIPRFARWVEVVLSPPTVVQGRLLGPFGTLPRELAGQLSGGMLARRALTESAG